MFLDPVKIKPNLLKFASDSFKNDFEIVLKALKHDGRSLRFTSERLCKNRSIVLAAVREKGYSICHASYRLNGDRKIAIEAITTNASACFNIAFKLKTDRNFILDVVIRFGWEKSNTKVFRLSMLLDSRLSNLKIEWQRMLNEVKKKSSHSILHQKSWVLTKNLYYWFCI